MSIQTIKPDDVRTVRSGKGIEGQAGVIYAVEGTNALYRWVPASGTMEPIALSTAQAAALAGLVSLNKSTMALDRPLGPSQFANGISNLGLTSYYKETAEAPFVSAVIVVRSNGNNPIYAPVPSEISFAIAVTETGDDSTDANKFTPLINGVSSNAVWSPTNPYGWQVGSLAGRPVTVSAADSGGTQVWEVRSQRLPLRSIPRADVIGGRPLYLLRVYKTPSSNVLGASSEDSTAAGADPMTENAKPYSRIRKAYLSANNTNGVASLTLIPSTPANRNYTYDVSIEFEFAAPVRSFLHGGDSIDENFGTMGWANKYVKSLSTQTAPCVLTMLGWSGRTSVDFCALLMYHLTSGAAVPTDLFLPVYTPNDSPGTIAVADARHARLLAVIAAYKAAGAQRVYLWDKVPNNTLNVGVDQGEEARLYSQAWGAARAADGTVTKYIRAGYVLGTGASPDRFLSVDPGGIAYNALHPNLAGIELFYQLIRQQVAL